MSEPLVGGILLSSLPAVLPIVYTAESDADRRLRCLNQKLLAVRVNKKTCRTQLLRSEGRYLAALRSRVPAPIFSRYKCGFVAYRLFMAQ